MLDSAAFASSLNCFAIVDAAVHAGEQVRQLVLEAFFRTAGVRNQGVELGDGVFPPCLPLAQ